jgi:hypothetical protein
MGVCKCCGKEFEKSHFIDYCSSECLHKDFWDNALDKDAVIIDGNCYHIVPDDKSDGGFLGFEGREFKIQFNDGRVVVTHNLWHQGEIPKERNIQDNAKFIN